MNTQIKCPYCDKLFEPTDAYKHELEERLLEETQTKHREEIEQLEKEKRLAIENKAKEIEEVRKKTAELVRLEIEGKVRKELEGKITSAQEESEARDKQNRELQDQLRDMFKQMRELKDEKDKIAIVFEKKLLEEQDKIKQDAKKEVQEELDLRIAEKDKKLNDALKANEELRRKLEQGSQQLQGEIQELRLEELLRTEFPFDEIKEVPKGISGADAIQVVRNRRGEICGTILWESKRTKNWSQGWIQKLKEDQRALKAEIAVLASAVLPQEIRSFGMVDSVMVVDMICAMNVARILRQQLLLVRSVQSVNENRTTKAEVAYNYLISNEFKQRIEVWVEYFRSKKEQIDKERAYFNKKWEKEEKEIQKISNTTSGIYGDIQGLIGNALPKVSYLELPDEIEEDKEE